MTNETNRAERRRAAREAAKSGATIEHAPVGGGNAAAAAIDAQFTPKPLPAAANNPPLSEEQSESLPKPGAKALPKAIGKIGIDNPRSPSARKLSKQQQRDEAQAVAKRQAHADSLRMPEPAPDNYKPGDTIPLHILNQRARQADEEARNEAADIGKAVGKFAEQQVNVRTPRSVMRSKRMRDAQQLMDRKRAETAQA